MRSNTRRTALFALLLPFLLLLSACVDVKAEFIIDENETVDFTVTLLDPQNRLTGDEVSEESRCEGVIGDVDNYTEEGEIKISPVTEGGIVGCLIEASDFSIDEVNELGYGELVHSDGKYHASTDGFTAILGDRGNTAQLSITFPGEITAAPGGELSNDDKTVTWTSPRSADHMNAQAEDGRSSNVALFVVILIPIFFALVLPINSRENKKKSDEPSEGEPEQNKVEPSSASKEQYGSEAGEDLADSTSSGDKLQSDS